MTKYLILFTHQRKSYIVELKTGYITQYHYDGRTPQFSGGWKFSGLSHVKRNEFIPLATIQRTPAILDEIQLQYKNGKPQYTVRDLDHGTRRQWGDGVISISLREAQ